MTTVLLSIQRRLLRWLCLDRSNDTWRSYMLIVLTSVTGTVLFTLWNESTNTISFDVQRKFAESCMTLQPPINIPTNAKQQQQQQQQRLSIDHVNSNSSLKQFFDEESGDEEAFEDDDLYQNFDESSLITSNNKLRPDAIIPFEGGFCVPWKINIDDWWTHHPKYTVQYENGTHYCMAPIRSKAKAEMFEKFYKNQFQHVLKNINKNSIHRQKYCPNVVTQRMWQSGWGADIAHVVDALNYGLFNRIPIQVSDDIPWHYASGKKTIKNGNASPPTPAACPLESMYCYFLPLTNCPPQNNQAYEGNGTSEFFLGHHPRLDEKETSWIVEYATRPQTWLRKAVFDLSKTIRLKPPCSVVHVRRADVVLHGYQSRRYHDMEEYIRANHSLSETILLLTDDSNAIQEAKTKFPNYNWVYIDRPRFQGAEGGWENQIPSNDPKQEVIVLMTIFKLVRKCNTLVHTSSNLGKYIAGVMKNHRRRGVAVINLDASLPKEAVFNQSYSMSKQRKAKKNEG